MAHQGKLLMLAPPTASSLIVQPGKVGPLKIVRHSFLVDAFQVLVVLLIRWMMEMEFARIIPRH